MTTRDLIIDKLTRHLTPTVLEVIDESHRHQGHAGWREGGESHFRVRIATRQFDGKSRLAQHRAIMDLLAPELQAGIHALAIEILGADSSPQPVSRVEQR